MSKKTIGVLIILGILICSLIGSTGVLALQAHLSLNPEGATYIDDNIDPWLYQSWVTGEKDFNLTIQYKQAGQNQETIEFIYLVTAVNRTPSGVVTVTVNGTEITDWTLVNESIPKAIVPTSDLYELPPAGVYLQNKDVWFAITKILVTLAPGGTITIPISVNPTTDDVKVHFDAVGADLSNTAIQRNSNSSDGVYYTPEPITLVMTAIGLLGVLGFVYRRKEE